MIYIGIYSSIGILDLEYSRPDQNILIVTCCNAEQHVLVGEVPLSPFLAVPVFKLPQIIGGYWESDT